MVYVLFIWILTYTRGDYSSEFMTILIFRCSWTNHLSKHNKACAPMGITTANNNKQSNNTTTTSNCLYSMFPNHRIFVVLRSSVSHIGGWTCPKVMYRSKYTWILVTKGISHVTLMSNSSPLHFISPLSIPTLPPSIIQPQQLQMWRTCSIQP